MDMKFVIPKQEEPVEYFLTSSHSDEDIPVALDAHSNGECLSADIPLIQVVKQECCDNELPIYDDDFAIDEKEPVDLFELVKKESDEETNSEPDSEYENNDVDNETDKDGSVVKKTSKREKSSNFMKMELKKRKISIIEDEDIVFEGPPYACNICPLTFPMEKSLRAHRSIHKGKRLRCDVCSKVFRNKSHIFEHMKIHASPKFSCPICFKTFAIKKSFILHQFIHKEKVFECDICKKRFRQKAHVAEHMKIHCKRIRRFPCELCDMAFYEQRTLNRHMSKIHSNSQRKRFRCPNAVCDKRYASIDSFRLHSCVNGRRLQEMFTTKCPLCNKLFGSKNELKRHTERTHDKPDNYHCTECGKTFLYLFYFSFVLHVAQNCSKNIVYTCDYCQKPLRTRNTLIEHFITQHGIANSTKKTEFCCPHCSKLYFRKNYLDRHVKIMHTDPKCDHCHRTFQTKSGFKKHQKSCMPKQTFDKYSKQVAVHGAQTADVYSCEICSRSFISETNLLEHRTEVHLKKNFELKTDYKYRCSTCPRSFGDRSSLSKHRIRMHINTNNFQCSSCSGTFVGEVLYQQHLARSDCARKVKPVYQCTVCSKIYTTNGKLRLHFAKIHANDGKYFHCDICKRAFATKVALQKHFQIGDHRSSWECEFCSKAFSQLSAYKTHVKHCNKTVQ